MAQIIPGTPFSSSSGHRPSCMTEPPVAGSVLDQSSPTVDSIRGLEPAGRMAAAAGRVAASRLRIAAPVACRQGQRLWLLAAADPSLHGVEIAVEFLDAAEYGREVGRLDDLEHFLHWRLRVQQHDPPGPFGHDLLGRKDRARPSSALTSRPRRCARHRPHVPTRPGPPRPRRRLRGKRGARAVVAGCWGGPLSCLSPCWARRITRTSRRPTLAQCRLHQIMFALCPGCCYKRSVPGDSFTLSKGAQHE